MTPAALLETRLTEVLMSALAPCDLGDGIEVVHDVESVEVEMECAVDDDALDDHDASNTTKMECAVDDDPVDEAGSTTKMESAVADEALDDHDVINTTKFARELVGDELGTCQFVRYSAPYERIEIQLDANAFVRATIEEAKSIQRRR
jgi:hypothetical protein